MATPKRQLDVSTVIQLLDLDDLETEDYTDLDDSYFGERQDSLSDSSEG